MALHFDNFMRYSIEQSDVRSNDCLGNITLRIMRYYASTLNRFSTCSMHWSATRSNIPSNRVTPC
ncbi:hypothetical protein Hdeb2414_s0007g00243741 [Helianthus debilis subsp. tardiflorus]